MGARLRRIAVAAMLAGASIPALPYGPVLADADDDAVARHSNALVFGGEAEIKAALEFLERRGNPDSAAALILALRYRGYHADAISAALAEITGGQGSGWFEWMVWQQNHADIVPHPSFRDLKREVLARIDPHFLIFFLDPWIERERMGLRLEEITWGGVAALDGIPSLDNPKMIPAGEADYLREDDLVFGVEINGDVRAYPLRIMGWHEMFNDVIGGVPVALAYCTLCGSGILYETRVEGREQPLVFGSSGLLYRSNKLMFDWETKSLWNQFTGEPVVGPLADSGITLKIRPVTITEWARWRARNPESRVLSLDTGHHRDYGSGVVYSDYFASRELMFPASVRADGPLGQKDYVFGMRDVGSAKAWPLAAFAGGAVINDAVGVRNVVLIGDQETRTVRAYERHDHTFAWTGSASRLKDENGKQWRVGEDGLIGPDGARLARLPGSVSYWFAWDGYLGVKSDLYGGDD